MKKRNREINIFSLSLMDVISGAMGAFLIIMIILARYYAIDPKVQDDVKDMKHRFQAAIASLDRIRDSAAAAQQDAVAGSTATAGGIREMAANITQEVNSLSAQLSGLQQKVNGLQDQLQQKSAELKRAQDTISHLDMRQPIVLMVRRTCTNMSPQANITGARLLVDSSRTSEKTKKPVDPFAEGASPASFDGDAVAALSNGTVAFLLSEIPAGSHFRLYVRLDPYHAKRTCKFEVAGTDYFDKLDAGASGEVSPDHPIMYLGQITVDQNHHATFKLATKKEEAEQTAFAMNRIAHENPPVK